MDYFKNSTTTKRNTTLPIDKRTLYANRRKAAENGRVYGWDGSEEGRGEVVRKIEESTVCKEGGLKVVVNGRMEPGRVMLVGADGKVVGARFRVDGGTGEMLVDVGGVVGVVSRSGGGNEAA